MKAIIYCRLSGYDKYGNRIQQQENDCIEYAKRKCYTVVDTLREGKASGTGGWYGHLGTDWNAPALNKALERAKKLGDFDVLVCWNADRFSRDVNKAIFFESEFKSVGVLIEYAGEIENNKFLKIIRKIPPKQVAEIVDSFQEEAYNEARRRGKI